MHNNNKITIRPQNPDNWLVNYNARIFAKEVTIGRTGSVENWHEITPEEKERLEKEWYPDED